MGAFALGLCRVVASRAHSTGSGAALADGQPALSLSNPDLGQAPVMKSPAGASSRRRPLPAVDARILSA